MRKYFQIILACLFTVAAANLSAQIVGSPTANVGETSTFTFDPEIDLTNPKWTTPSGTARALKFTESPAYRVNVTWSAAGTFIIKFTADGGVSYSLTVVVSTPCSVGQPTASNITQCGGIAASLTATVGTNGNAVRWYSASSGGTLLYTGTTYTSTVAASTTYYISSYNTSTSCESTRRAVTITVPVVDGPLVLPSSLTKTSCGPSTFTLTSSIPNSATDIRWYTMGGVLAGTGTTFQTPLLSTTTTYNAVSYNQSNGCESQKVACVMNIITKPVTPTVTGTSQFASQPISLSASSSGATTFKWYAADQTTLVFTGNPYVAAAQTVSTANFVYVAGSNGTCDGPKVAVSSTIVDMPVIKSSSFYLAKGQPVTLSVSPGTYDTYQWLIINTDGSTTNVGTLSTLSVTAAGSYKVTVTKAGLTATAQPVTIGLQWDALNKNYVLTNTFQSDGIPLHPILDNLSVDILAQGLQYLDGFGRLEQTVTTQSSPSKKDIVQPIQYNGLGLEERKFLPYVSDENNGRFKDNPVGTGTYSQSPHYKFYNNGTSDNIADDTRPFSKSIFQADPLNEIAKQGSPGLAWQPDVVNDYTSTDRTLKKLYDYNAYGEVPWLEYVYPTVTYPLGSLKTGKYAFYPAYQLIKNSTKDEQGNEVIEFSNKSGQIVLKKVQADATSYAQTYYVYDDFGNLVTVLQPEGMKQVVNSLPVTWSNLYGAAVSDNVLTRTGASGYPTTPTGLGSATSTTATETLAANTDGWVEMIAKEVDKSRMVGLASTNQIGINIDFAIEFRSDSKAYAKESSVDVAVLGNYVKGTIVRVSREGTSIKYYVDGILKYTSSKTSSSALIVDAAMNENSSTLSTVTTSFKVGAALTSALNVYAFQYTYDGRGRMTQKLVPGAGSVYMVYDNRDRLVFTQDANQRVNKYWTFTKYDILDRSVLTGIYQADSVLAQSKMQRRVNVFYKAVPGNGGAWYETYTGVATVHGYDNKSYPQESVADNYLTVTYYDNYDFRTSWSGTYTYASDGLSTTVPTGTYTQVATNLQNIRLTGQVTGSKIKVLDGGVRGGSTWLKSISYFDNKYRVIQTLSDNIRGGKDVVSNLYDFAGKVIMTKTTHSTAIPSSYSTTRRLIYDHAGRLTEVWHKVGTGTDYRIIFNQYNELGQLTDKKLHSVNANAADNKQSVDYRYNIRGWLTSMNNSQLTNDGTTNDDSGDLFGINLLYNTADVNLGSTALYNGNISGMKWSTNLGLSDVKEAGYNFTYDAMNRLVHGNSRMNKTDIWQVGNYSENNISYDLNGNINALQRTNVNYNSQLATIDNLVYNYGTSGNQLQYVQDNAPAADINKGFADGNVGTAQDYTYDANGNMTRDLNKNIGNTIADASNLITYNYLNLPETVTKSGNTVRYIYDAAGRKLSQLVNTTQKRTDYIGEFIYENDQLQFINHEEGRIVTSSTKTIYTNSFSGASNITSADVTASNSTVSIPAAVNGESYAKVTSSNTTATTTASAYGVTIGGTSGTFTVAAGNRYRVRVKGYRTTNPVYLQITAGSTVLNAPGTALPVSNTLEGWVEQVVTIPASTTTMKVALTWGSNVAANEIFYVNELEVNQLTTQAAEYQYNLKDHLGSVHLTFTTAPETITDIATLETANASAEKSKFLRIDNARIVGHYLFDHTNGSSPTTVSGAAQRLSGQTNEVYGVAKSLSVMPGDVISMEVYAKYIDKTSTNRTTALNTLLSQIAAGPGGGANVVDGGTYSSSTTSFPYAGLNGTNASTGSGPKAYLNWLVFDKNFKLVPSLTGYQRLSAAPRETGADVAHEKLANTLTIKEPGYVYIYYSNEEGASSYEVYFDDLKVTHAKSVVISSLDYYPYGLTYNCYSRENSVKQDYLYNGKEQQDELNLGWLDYGWRMYDPQLGKWNQIDPLVGRYEDWSPYNYVQCNPVSRTDPDGRWVNFVVGALIGAATDYAAQVAVNLIDGRDIGDALTDVDGVSILTSAAMGAVSSGASAFTKTIGVQTGKQLAKTTTQQVVRQTTKVVTVTAAKVRNKIDQAAAARGRANEKKVLREEGMPKNTKTMSATDPKTGKEVNTIPDGMKSNGGTVEVKDTKVLNDSPQLRTQSEISAANGQQATVITGTNTKVSSTVENRMNVVRKDYIGPQN